VVVSKEPWLRRSEYILYYEKPEGTQMTPSTFSQFVTNTESPTLQRYLGVDEDTKRRMLDILRCGREVEHSQQSLNHAIHTITVRTAIAAVEWLKESSPDRHPTFQLVLQWCLNVTDLTKVGEDIKEKRLTEAVRMTIRAREGYQEWMQEVQDFKVNAWTDIHPQILAMIEETNASKEGLQNKTQELADEDPESTTGLEDAIHVLHGVH
jgi:hypothetical protein